MPLVVLIHGVPLDASLLPDGWPVEEDERLWRELHADLVTLVPHARLIIAERSGHFVQIDQPGLVVSAIQEVMTEGGGSATPGATT